MNQLPALLKREFIEHRNMLLYVPLAITAVLLGLQLIAAFVLQRGTGMNMTIDASDGHESREVLVGAWFDQLLVKLQAMTPSEQAHAMDAAYIGASWPLLAILWFLVFFYLLGTLYDDRRDRSVLFWKSMPVSDAMTVGSKLMIALIVIPAIYFAYTFAVQISFFVISALMVGDAPAQVAALVVDPWRLAGRWFELLGFHLVTVFWCAPFYAWVLLVSAWARSVPFVWALAIPVSLAAIDKLLVTGELGSFMVRHTAPVGWDEEHVMTLGETIVSYGTSWEFPVALVIAGVFVYLTIRIRGKTDEI